MADSVACVLEQEYPGGFELVLAVGPSKDRTEAIARELAAADSRIIVVPNPSGQIASAMNAAVKTARYPIITRIDGHALLPDGYLRTAVQTLLDSGAAYDDVDLVWVPGAWELPAAARVLLQSERYDALVAVGAVIRGETPHFDYVAGEASRGLADVGVEFEIPVGFGLLTCDTVAQAEEALV